MAMLIELPPSLETTLNETAQRRGVTAESLVLQAIQDKYRPSSQATASDMPFNYDLERMQTMMAGLETPEGIAKNTLTVPKGKSAEELLEWFDSLSESDFVGQS